MNIISKNTLGTTTTTVMRHVSADGRVSITAHRLYTAPTYIVPGFDAFSHVESFANDILSRYGITQPSTPTPAPRKKRTKVPADIRKAKRLLKDRAKNPDATYRGVSSAELEQRIFDYENPKAAVEPEQGKLHFVYDLASYNLVRQDTVTHYQPVIAEVNSPERSVSGEIVGKELMVIPQEVVKVEIINDHLVVGGIEHVGIVTHGGEVDKLAKLSKDMAELNLSRLRKYENSMKVSIAKHAAFVKSTGHIEGVDESHRLTLNVLRQCIAMHKDVYMRDLADGSFDYVEKVKSYTLLTPWRSVMELFNFTHSEYMDLEEEFNVRDGWTIQELYIMLQKYRPFDAMQIINSHV